MYKTKLQEVCHQRRWGLPRYSSMKDGPDHAPLFKASVYVSRLSFHSSISCNSSKQAQNDAARVAFLHFTSPPPSRFLPEGQGLETDDELPRGLDIDNPDVSGDLLECGEATAGLPKIGETSQGHEINPKASDVQCRYKSQLENYAQRKNIDRPTYTSTREGPAHAPCYKATVAVDGHIFESPDFFKTRKLADHAVAKIALMSLSSDGFQEDDSGFYKSLLQELTQREDFSKPIYMTIKSGPPHMPTFFSTLEVEGEVFYGKAGRSKKEAETKAAKVAYTSLIERGQNQSIGFTSETVKADGDMKSTRTSEFDINITSQNLERSKESVSSPDTENAEILSANTETSSDDYLLPPVKTYTDEMTGYHSPEPVCHMPASSPPIAHADVSALSVSDSSERSAAERRSYLLCNRVRVYPYLPETSFPKGITVLPISDNRWVAVSLEFPNEEGN